MKTLFCVRLDFSNAECCAGGVSCLVVLREARRVPSNCHRTQFSERTAGGLAIHLCWRCCSAGFLDTQRLHLNNGGLVLVLGAEVAVNKGVMVGLTDCEDILMCQSYSFSACARGVEADKLGPCMRTRCAGGDVEVGGEECASAGAGRRRPAQKLAGVPCEIFAKKGRNTGKTAEAVAR